MMTQVGEFQILGELGRGGMGAVFEARDVNTGRHVALKVVLGEGQSPERLVRLEREGTITASLDHPGIVRIHAAGRFQGRPYLAYELVPNVRPWDEVMAELPLERRLKLVRDVARALGSAHAKGIVHRDIKPDNLLVDGEGRVKVADFGLAIAQDVERLTQTGALVGTPSFMAPEQFGGGKAPVGPQADVWALGAVLYGALTGVLPFEAATIYQLAALVQRARPVPPRELEPEIPADLEAICLRALSAEPADRYSDGAAFAADLDRLLAGEPVEGRRRNLRRLARRALWVAVPAAAVGLFVAAATLGVEPEAPPTPVLAARSTPAPAQKKFEGDAELEGDEPDGDDTPTGLPADIAETIATDVIPLGGPVVENLVQAMKEGVSDLVNDTINDTDPEARAMIELHKGRLLDKLNPEAALRHYRTSADLGNAEAARLLAERVWEGGTTEDKAEAFRYFKLGGEGGDDPAMVWAARILINGDGVPRDRRAGYQWYLRAADVGNRDAMLKVAREFARGKHLDRDLIAARFWTQAARDRGYDWKGKPPVPDDPPAE